MKHQAFDELKKIADVSVPHAPVMTRRERLERWANLLDREPDRRFGTFHQTEYMSSESRSAMRSLGSPISVAFADPLLRAEGLDGDSYGQAQRFFSLSDRQLHEIVCSCRHGTSMTAAAAARQVRAAIPTGRFNLVGWVTGFLNALYVR